MDIHHLIIEGEQSRAEWDLKDQNVISELNVTYWSVYLMDWSEMASLWRTDGQYAVKQNMRHW